MNTQIIERQGASSLVFLSMLSIAFWMSSTSVATVPLQNNEAAIAAPAIDDLLKGGRNGESIQMLEEGTLSEGMETGWSGYEAQGDHARSVGKWSEAEKGYAMAVRLLEQVPGKENNLDLAALLNKLGVTRLKQIDFAGAETAFRLALTIYTSTLGSEDLRVADTLDLVASALFEQQQGRALAGPLFYRAWVIREGSLAPDHPAIADSLHHMAVSLYADNLSLALSLFHRSTGIREKVFGHDHPLVANSLNAMAQLYEMHNRPDLAIPLYQDALTIQESVFGPNASETQQARSSLDMAHQSKDHLHEVPNSRE